MPQQIKIRAVWSLEVKKFLLELGDKTWELTSAEFLSMVEHGEKQLLVKDGQNKVGRSQFELKINDFTVNFSDTRRSSFYNIVAYFRKVYDSWLNAGLTSADSIV